MHHFSGIGFLLVAGVVMASGWCVISLILWLLSFIHVSVG